MKRIIKVVDKERGIVQTTTTDERWYSRPVKNPDTGLDDIEFVPSVTWIASHYPKGIGFYKWLADKGWDEAEAIKIAAGDKGSKIHQAIHSWLCGDKILIDSKILNPNSGVEEELTVEEYTAIISFTKWFEEEQPKKIISLEYVVWGDGYAGTVDIKYQKQDDRIAILDIKSSKSIWPEYELQLSAYKHAEEKIDVLEILQVGYNLNKKGFKVTEILDKFDLFLASKQIWANESKNVKPAQKDYPIELPDMKSLIRGTVIPESNFKKEDRKIKVVTEKVKN